MRTARLALLCCLFLFIGISLAQYRPPAFIKRSGLSLFNARVDSSIVHKYDDPTRVEPDTITLSSSFSSYTLKNDREGHLLILNSEKKPRLIFHTNTSDLVGQAPTPLDTLTDLFYSLPEPPALSFLSRRLLSLTSQEEQINLLESSTSREAKARLTHLRRRNHEMKMNAVHRYYSLFQSASWAKIADRARTDPFDPSFDPSAMPPVSIPEISTQTDVVSSIEVPIFATVQGISLYAPRYQANFVDQWILLSYDDFTYEDSTWIVTATTQTETFNPNTNETSVYNTTQEIKDTDLRSTCGTNNQMLGGYCVFSSHTAFKTFSQLPPHHTIKVQARVHFIDRWDGEYIYMRINGEIVWLQNHRHCLQIFSDLCKGVNVCGSDHSDRLSTKIEFVIEHADPFLSIEFGSSLESHPCEASWGVDDIMLSYRA